MNSKSTPMQMGILMGIVSIIINVIILLFFPESMGDNSFGIPQILGFISFFALLYFMFKAANDVKAANGGFISLKEALKNSYLVAVITSVISFIFTMLSKYVLFSDVYDRMGKRIIEKTVEKMEEQGQPEEAIDMAVGMTEKFMDMGMWLALPGMLIVYFIIALIISAIIKKNPETV